MTTTLKTLSTGLLLLTVGTLLATPVLAAPGITQSLSYEVLSDGQDLQCSSACSYTVQQKIIQTTFTPCPPGYVGGYYTVTITVKAIVYINGNPYTVSKTVTLQKTGACVYGVSAGCQQGAPTFATDEFSFVNNVKTVSATGLLVSPDASTVAYVGQFTLTGYDERGNALGSFQFTCTGLQSA